MSEIQKAINILKDCADAASGTEFSQVFLMGATALQDQAEREMRRCKFCFEMKSFQIDGRSAKFCPMCGRDLRKPVRK